MSKKCLGKCLGSVQTVGGYAFESDDLKYDLKTDSQGNTIAVASTNFLDTLTKNLGTTVNTILDTANKIGSTYQNITGSTLVNTQSSKPQIDNDTVTQIMNSAINQVKRYGVYVGIGVGAIILITLLNNKRKA